MEPVQIEKDWSSSLSFHLKVVQDITAATSPTKVPAMMTPYAQPIEQVPILYTPAVGPQKCGVLIMSSFKPAGNNRMLTMNRITIE